MGGRGVFSGVPVLMKDLGQQIAGVVSVDGTRAHLSNRLALTARLVAGYRLTDRRSIAQQESHSFWSAGGGSRSGW